MNAAHLTVLSFFNGASPSLASDTFGGYVAAGALAFFDGFTGTADGAASDTEWLNRFRRRAMRPN